MELLDSSVPKWGAFGMFAEGEVVGTDRKGRVVAWSNDAGDVYLTGATLGNVDMGTLGFLERDRLDRDAATLGLEAAAAAAPSPGM